MCWGGGGGGGGKEGGGVICQDDIGTCIMVMISMGNMCI